MRLHLFRNVRAAAVRSLAILVLILLTGPSAFSQSTYYWDGDGTNPGFGTAGGTWGATSSNWSTSPTGTLLPGSVTTGLLDSVNFGNSGTALAPGTITISGTVNVGNITFGTASPSIALSGGTINLTSAATITANSPSVADTINSVLSGAGTSLTVAGTGILTLAGSNTYTGATVITFGVLQATNLANGSSASSLGESSNAASNLVFGSSTATLRYTGTANVTIDRGFTLSNNGSTNGGAND